MEDPSPVSIASNEGHHLGDFDEPPDYDETSNARSSHISQSGSRTQPPRPLAEHVSTLEDSASRPWLSLIVRSRSPSPSYAPVLYEDEPIGGEVIMDLLKPQSIEEVTVSINGLIVCSVSEICAFYSETRVLWKRPEADPHMPGRQLNFWGPDNRERLIGRHVWPFTFKIPGQFAVEARIGKKYNLASVERAPPSLGGNGGHPSSIEYRIIVDVKRAAILLPDSSLYTRLNFTPLSRPSPPSPLRIEAYREGAQLLGPEIDPDGWKVFPSIDIRGVLFRSHTINVNATFALATPLCYTRGSVIPCFLTLQCDDKQALDLFANVRAPTVKMRRKLEFLFPSSFIGGNEGLGYIPGTEERIPLSIATWRLVQEDAAEENTGNKRELYGELSLPRYLIPSFTFGAFQVKYVVDIYPFEVPGFVPESDDRLFRTEVSIATAFAEGPRPRTYLPPGYIPDREVLHS